MLQLNKNNVLEIGLVRMHTSLFEQLVQGLILETRMCPSIAGDQLPQCHVDDQVALCFLDIVPLQLSE